MTVDQIVDQAMSYGFDLVTVTGGEPLIQQETPELVSALTEKNFTVLVETNGSLDISVLPKDVIRIVDIKCPTSGEHQSMRWENIWSLGEQDEVKFVIADRHDYEWAREIIAERFRVAGTKVLLSVVFGELPPRNLVEWMLEDRIKARFQLQLHKVVWPGEQRGV
jgi:7-carboxy-7-deazaguanine synthase